MRQCSPKLPLNELLIYSVMYFLCGALCISAEESALLCSALTRPSTVDIKSAVMNTEENANAYSPSMHRVQTERGALL